MRLASLREEEDMRSENGSRVLEVLSAQMAHQEQQDAKDETIQQWSCQISVVHHMGVPLVIRRVSMERVEHGQGLSHDVWQIDAELFHQGRLIRVSTCAKSRPEGHLGRQVGPIRWT